MSSLTKAERDALEEWQAWKARLELERWTTSERDPETAIRQLIATESTTPPLQRARYQSRVRPKGTP